MLDDVLFFVLPEDAEAVGFVVYVGFFVLSVSAEFVGCCPFTLSPSTRGLDGVLEGLEIVVSGELASFCVAGSHVPPVLLLPSALLSGEMDSTDTEAGETMVMDTSLAASALT